MREYQETTRHSHLGESPGRSVDQGPRKSGFWLKGKLCFGLLTVAATAALFIAGSGTSALESPQAPAEEAPLTSAQVVPGVEADPVIVWVASTPSVEAAPVIVWSAPASDTEADTVSIPASGFNTSQTCHQESEISDTESADLIAAAATLSEAFPNLSSEGTEGTASPAQIAAFILDGCEVDVQELLDMAQDGQIGAETTKLVKAITSENLADFPNIYMESRCLRAGTDYEGQVLSAPHRVRRIVTALRDVWLAVQQPENAEFEQVMTAIGERLVGDIWAALVVDEGDGDFSLKEQSEAEAAQIKQEIEQTCGYELVRTDAVV